MADYHNSQTCLNFLSRDATFGPYIKHMMQQEESDSPILKSLAQISDEEATLAQIEQQIQIVTSLSGRRYPDLLVWYQAEGATFWDKVKHIYSSYESLETWIADWLSNNIMFDPVELGSVSNHIAGIEFCLRYNLCFSLTYKVPVPGDALVTGSLLKRLNVAWLAERAGLPVMDWLTGLEASPVWFSVLDLDVDAYLDFVSCIVSEAFGTDLVDSVNEQFEFDYDSADKEDLPVRVPGSTWSSKEEVVHCDPSNPRLYGLCSQCDGRLLPSQCWVQDDHLYCQGCAKVRNVKDQNKSKVRNAWIHAGHPYMVHCRHPSCIQQDHCRVSFFDAQVISSDGRVRDTVVHHLCEKSYRQME